MAQIERGDLAVDTLGLHLAEAKNLLQRVQEVLIGEQVRPCLAEQVACSCCGRTRAYKDTKTIVVRTLFGTLQLPSPRWRHCSCQFQATRTFSPLATALPERTTPELLYLESKFAGLVSYGLSAKWLAETLPLGRPLNASTVRLHALATGERLESERGPEQAMFAEGCQLDWDELPRPDLPLTVGLDGGYVHSSQQRTRRDGWFEVIAGKSMPTDGPAKCFGFVQTYDTKPKRRLFEVLKSQVLVGQHFGRAGETDQRAYKLVRHSTGGSSSSGSISGGMPGAISGGLTITTVSGATAGGSGTVGAGWTGAATCPILIGIVNCVSLPETVLWA